MNEDKLLVVAKAVYDNLPFENENFAPDSVNECAEFLKRLLAKDHISQSWLDAVYKAAINRHAIYISCNREWVWNFLTMAKGTRDDIIREVQKIDFNKVKVKVHDDPRH
jgi:hypothetical protein